MTYIKNNLLNTWEFLRSSEAYFRDVLIAHGFLLFILIPVLGSSTKFILTHGGIHYLSFDNLGTLATQHPKVLFALLMILLLIVLTIFFEFTFLLLSVYFIKKKQSVSLKQLLKMTLLQIKKIRPLTFLFFLFYFFLILPIGGLTLNSDLMAKIKIPAFILDFIFANRVVIISACLIGYLLLLYIGIRVIFALPEMILRDRSFLAAIKESLQVTKHHFFSIIGRFIFIGGSILLFSSAAFFLLIAVQAAVETWLSAYALLTAVFIMTILQLVLLINIVLSTVGIFYIIVDFMEDEGFLPEIPTWFQKEPVRETKIQKLNPFLFTTSCILFSIGVGIYNLNYLTSPVENKPVAISHRGVSDENGVQNSLEALEKTSTHYTPDYIEMDIQQTLDGHFIVYHDFSFKQLTGFNRSPESATLAEVQNLVVHENGQTAKIPTFDEYLDLAEKLNQKLLVEIKTQKREVTNLVNDFLEKYQERLIKDQHLVQSLTFNVVEQIKSQTPQLNVGYILPFNLVGPPLTKADFLTMEYSTINQNFIQSAHSDQKKVFVWTANDEDAISRMQFYGADGIITDRMDILNASLLGPDDEISYSDKLLNFVLGFG